MPRREDNVSLTFQDAAFDWGKRKSQLDRFGIALIDFWQLLSGIILNFGSVENNWMSISSFKDLKTL